MSTAIKVAFPMYPDKTLSICKSPPASPEEQSPPTNECIELATHAVFQIGDVTIIATAHFQDEGKSCFDSLANLLIEEAEKG